MARQIAHSMSDSDATAGSVEVPESGVSTTLDHHQDELWDPAAVQPGAILAGKYQVEHVLGSGGMGTVVAARHIHLLQRVAIKFLLPEALKRSESVERFLREARNAVQLKSEHVGRVIDVGTLDSGAPFMVMELLEGTDLAGHLQAEGALPAAVASELVLQACDALAEAHALGIVHRDIKPANLFLTQRPDSSPLIKVLDFGISKTTQDLQPDFHLTRTSTVMGSPGYMSPEQLRSTRDVDGRTDVWSLGVVLYELVAGVPPFTGASFSEVCIKVVMEPAPPVAAPLPKGFMEVVNRCLEKDPTKRFRNVAELAAALAPFAPEHGRGYAERVARVLRGRTTRETTGSGGAGQPTTLTGASWHTAGREAPGGWRSRLGWIGAGLAVVAIVGAAMAATLHGGDEPATAKPVEVRSGAGAAVPRAAGDMTTPAAVPGGAAAAAAVTATADAGVASAAPASGPTDTVAGADSAAGVAGADSAAGAGAAGAAKAADSVKDKRGGAGARKEGRKTPRHTSGDAAKEEPDLFDSRY
jgi:eukaryotic-like serine/threonine-protein kinase